MRLNLKLALLFFTVVIALAACKAPQMTDTAIANKTVEDYHRLYNEQNYEEIFNHAHEEARRTKSKEALGLALAESFRVFGKHRSSELFYSKVSAVNDKERQVELVYKSKFENGTRNETFLIINDDQKGALHSIGEISDEQLAELKSK
jgi:hypothetical protein